jgi:hypothetical protein
LGCQDHRGDGDPVHVVEVEPEEQRVAADQRAEQRAERVPAVEPPGHVAEVSHPVSQGVEHQRQDRR